MRFGTFKKITFHWSTRIILHLPIGVVTRIMLAGGWPDRIAAVLFWIGFIYYEWDECKHLGDGAWVDVSGALIGLAGYVLFLRWLPIVAAWGI